MHAWIRVDRHVLDMSLPSLNLCLSLGIFLSPSCLALREEADVTRALFKQFSDDASLLLKYVILSFS